MIISISVWIVILDYVKNVSQRTFRPLRPSSKSSITRGTMIVFISFEKIFDTTWKSWITVGVMICSHFAPCSFSVKDIIRNKSGWEWSFSVTNLFLTMNFSAMKKRSERIVLMDTGKKICWLVRSCKFVNLPVRALSKNTLSKLHITTRTLKISCVIQIRESIVVCKILTL